MNAREQGFLLLTSQLGQPQRKVLTVAQLRTLANRVRSAKAINADREMTIDDLVAIGYSREEGARIIKLLEGLDELSYYLSKAARMDCYPLTRASEQYPLRLRKRLGMDCPGCLWLKGDIELLRKPAVALIGSRDLRRANAAFAAEAGRQAAMQGYVLVSGNARGADKIAQEACLQAGGEVISVVADSLEKCPLQKNVLYISEESFNASFSSQRALSRNRVIHALADRVLVAQATFGKGGTWSGTVQNLRNNWSCVFCYQDGSAAAAELEQLGAVMIDIPGLFLLDELNKMEPIRFDQ